jgi:Arc/MetJ family transcription regulator
MATNLALDDALVGAAKRLGHHRTKRDAVNEALRLYVARKQQLGVLDLFGKLEWDPRYDHKVERRRR